MRPAPKYIISVRNRVKLTEKQGDWCGDTGANRAGERRRGMRDVYPMLALVSRRRRGEIRPGHMGPRGAPEVARKSRPLAARRRRRRARPDSWNTMIPHRFFISAHADSLDSHQKSGIMEFH